jgi:hypothetical protein
MRAGVKSIRTAVKERSFGVPCFLDVRGQISHDGYRLIELMEKVKYNGHQYIPLGRQGSRGVVRDGTRQGFPMFVLEHHMS